MMERKFSAEAAALNPVAFFDQPNSVVQHPALSRKQKLTILKNWERDARGLAVAEEEGMAGGEESMLSRIRGAINDLGEDHPRPKSTSKYG
jgi:hypothetical protein